MQEWFYEMFRYAAESRAALRIVAELLGENGPFQKDDYLITKLGSDFFLALTEANPAAALKCLQRTIGTWSKEELLQFGEGRRSVVWALERIAMWKDLFIDAARLLLRLGEAENESYSNNASGVFAGLFSPGPGEVAPTEASPEERFPVLQEALDSKSKEVLRLALEACSSALGGHFYRTVGPEYQGLRAVKLWSPKSREEVLDAYRRVWQLLYSKIPELPEAEQKEAILVLINNTRRLTFVPDLADMIMDDVSDLARKPFGDKGQIIKIVEEVLHYEERNLPIEIKQRWQNLRESLIGNDFASLMRRYVSLDLLEDQFDSDGNRVDKSEQPIKNLVQQVLEDNNLIEPELSWVVTDEAKSGYRFGYELGINDVEFTLLPLFLNAQRKVSDNPRASVFFLSGYFRALFERDLMQWEALLDELARDSKLTKWVAELTWRSGMSDRAALRVLNLTKAGTLQPYHFRMFGLGSVITNLSEEIFIQWIEFLLETPEDYAASIALDLYHFFYLRKEAKYKLPKHLTLKLLTHPSLFKAPKEGIRNQMDDFHWKEIGTAFFKMYPEDSLEIVDTAFEHFGEDGTIIDGYRGDTHQVINAIANKYPGEVWKRVTKYLGPPIDARAFYIKDWLRGRGLFEEKEGSLTSFTKEMIWQWVDEDIDRRAWYLASFVPKVLFRSEDRICWAREVLIRYGDRKDVQSNLIANFSTEGWSGPASLHYENKKKNLLEFRESEDNANVKRWIDNYVSELDRMIEREKISEERMD